MPNRGYPAGARSRATGTGQIGVMVPLIHPGCFADILSGAAEALYEHDLRAVLGPTRHSRAREVSLLGQLADGAADGAIIIAPEESSDEFAALAGRGFPVVIVDPRTEIADGIPVVSAAHSAGATQATRHLLDLGHRRIAAIGGPPGWIATEERMRGYHAALAGARVLPDPELVQYSDFRIEGGRQAAARLLGLPDAPTAIFAFNDSMAVGVLQASVQFPFDVVGPELAAFGKEADKIDISRALCDRLVGQVQDRLEIAVPRNKTSVCAEHRNSIAHIVEGDAQLGLSIPQFLEQSRILDRDHRLIGETGRELDLFIGERLDARAGNNENADQRVLTQQRNAKHGTIIE